MRIVTRLTDLRQRLAASQSTQAQLAEALVAEVAITDEASAIEWAGQAPRLIEGRADNLKVTRPEDLEWLRLRWGQRGGL